MNFTRTKDGAFSLLEEVRAELIASAREVARELIRAHGAVSVREVEEVMEERGMLEEAKERDIDPRWWGPVFVPAEFEKVGERNTGNSDRRGTHARMVTLWGFSGAPQHKERKKVTKLFNLKRGRKPGTCYANRCKDDGIAVPGDLWNETEVELCARHISELEKYLAANPDGPPPAEKPSTGVGLAVVDVDVATLQATITPFFEQGRDALDFVKSYVIETHEQLEEVAVWLAEVKLQRNSIEAKEKEITGPLNTVLQQVRSLFRPAKTFWADAEKLLKSKIAAAKLREESNARLQLQAAAAAHSRGDNEGRETALSKITTVGDVHGVSTIAKWSYIIEDESLLPREFLMPNHTLLKEHCAHSTQHEPTAVPGVKFIPDVSVRVTPSKVLA